MVLQSYLIPPSMHFHLGGIQITITGGSQATTSGIIQIKTPFTSEHKGLTMTYPTTWASLTQMFALLATPLQIPVPPGKIFATATCLTLTVLIRTPATDGSLDMQATSAMIQHSLISAAGLPVPSAMLVSGKI
jgi:hypothetical protein